MDRRLGKVLGMGWRIFEGFFLSFCFGILYVMSQISQI